MTAEDLVPKDTDRFKAALEPFFSPEAIKTFLEQIEHHLDYQELRLLTARWDGSHGRERPDLKQRVRKATNSANETHFASLVTEAGPQEISYTFEFPTLNQADEFESRGNLCQLDLYPTPDISKLNSVLVFVPDSVEMTPWEIRAALNLGLETMKKIAVVHQDEIVIITHPLVISQFRYVDGASNEYWEAFHPAVPTNPEVARKSIQRQYEQTIRRKTGRQPIKADLEISYAHSLNTENNLLGFNTLARKLGGVPICRYVSALDNPFELNRRPGQWPGRTYTLHLPTT